MESCILVPRDFSLVLTLHPDPRNILEMCVAVWSNSYLKAGTSFHPESGQITYEKLEIYSTLKKDNIRRQFGCYDEVLMVEDREVRHCNWIRFVKSSNKLEDVNMIGMKIKEEVVYQLVKDIRPNEEVIVYFQDLPNLTIKTEVTEEHLISDTMTDKENISPDSMELSSVTSSPSPGSQDVALSRSTGIISGSEDSGHHSDMNLSKTPSPPPFDMVPIKRPRERTWLPCEVCQKKFDRPSLLKRHMRTHTGEKPHACDVCGKAFSTSSSLNTHRRIHSGEKPHECNVCGKKFTASSNLYYHRMTHKKEKPHKCSMCTKSFPTPGDLKSHMYVHSGSWPFKCDICNRGFSKQTNLKNHMLLHSGDKPHQCTICDKKFALQCNLKTHMKTHDDENTPVCVRCNKMAATADGTCLKCRGDLRLADDNDIKSNTSSDFSIAKLTESSSKRRRLDSGSLSGNNTSPFLQPPSSQYPFYCSTPIEKRRLNYSSSPFASVQSTPELYPNVDMNQYYQSRMMQRNYQLGSMMPVPGTWSSPMAPRY